jgi:hypothetical protein
MTTTTSNRFFEISDSRIENNNNQVIQIELLASKTVNFFQGIYITSSSTSYNRLYTRILRNVIRRNRGTALYLYSTRDTDVQTINDNIFDGNYCTSGLQCCWFLFVDIIFDRWEL